MDSTELSHPSADGGISTAEREILSWRRHLLLEEPGKLSVVFCAAVFCEWAAWLLFQNILFNAAVLFMLGSATSEYLFPIANRLSSRTASCRFGANRFELEWSKLARVLIYKDGVRLSPLAAPSRLDSFRGVFLRFARDGQPGDRKSVLAAIAELRPSKQSEASS
jgi:hypothetical protein